MSFTPLYLSAGANRHSAAADWSDNGILAFGTDYNIAIWQPSLSPPRGITSLLRGHGAAVRAVRFIPSLPDRTEPSYFLSGAGGGEPSLKLWASESAGSTTPGPDPVFSCVQTVDGAHQGAVNCIAACPPSSPSSAKWRRLVATGSADATIKIWAFDPSSPSRLPPLTLLQTVVTAGPRFFPLALALALAPAPARPDDSGRAFILAAAGSHRAVQIYVASDDGARDRVALPPPQFAPQASLPGHEDWIRSLDMVRESDDPAADLLIASASGDKHIRLWRVHADDASTKTMSSSSSSFFSSSSSLPPSSSSLSTARKPSNKCHQLRSGYSTLSITFEALLLGHEDWIYSARWQRPRGGGGGGTRLLSASADNSLAVWEADAASGIWVTSARLGEISREKGATTATGSTGGFWTGLWGADGREVVCLARTGSWRRWRMGGDEGAFSGSRWTQEVGISGHVRAVTGLAWSRPDGGYLLSASLDQTTRLHAPWGGMRQGGAHGAHEGHVGHGASGPRGATVGRSWHEMSRPQIHGYDLSCIDSLGGSQFVSGADEKLMRVFCQPRAVAELLGRVSGVTCAPSANGAHLDAADMPSLGLSNRAINVAEPDATVADSETDVTTAPDLAPALHRSVLDIDRPPTEDVLSRFTLWPETEKLYGHGYEISCVAASHDGSLIASGCRASTANHAVVRLFETARWTELRPPLAAHSLTATRLRFSPDDRRLLSVGRDRAWAVFEREGDKFVVRQTVAKAHSRMILDAAWAPAAPPGDRQRRAVFATAGRDKQVRIWALGEACAVTALAVDEPVTAVDFFPRLVGGGSNMVLAVGTEAGRLIVHTIGAETLSVISSVALEERLWPAKPILQLAWRPPGQGEHKTEGEPNTGAEHKTEAEGADGERTWLELAVAADDGSLRLLGCDLGCDA